MVHAVAPDHAPKRLRQFTATFVVVDNPGHESILAQLCDYLLSVRLCDKREEGMILAAIVVCEVGFWVFLAAGLLARYGLRLPRLGAALIACVPLVDLALLAFTVVDLRHGAEPQFAHGLAAVYLGVTVAFGHSMILWADVRAAHRFAGGPPPPPKPAGGTPERMRREWREFGKAVVAMAISAVLLLVAITIVGDRVDTAELWAWLPRLGVVLVGWFVGWPLLETIRVWRVSRRQRATTDQRS
jgi:hypothetical protein